MSGLRRFLRRWTRPSLNGTWRIPAEREKFPVFLLMGQSNMAGHGCIREDDPWQPGDLSPVPQVLVFGGQGTVKSSRPRGWLRWRPAAHPLHLNQRSAGFGLGLPFASRLLEETPGLSIGLVPCAWSGTPIDQLGPGSSLYQNAILRARIATKSGTLAGVLWHQGESDTQTGPLAHSHAQKLGRLIRRLRSAALKELVRELIHASPDQGDPAMLGLMAKRIGDLEAERGLQWLAAEAYQAAENSPFEALFRPALDGWSESDPTGLLIAYFDDDKSITFRIRPAGRSTWGEDGMGPDIVAKAAAHDPDEVWRLLRTWQSKSMGDDFFEGLDPSLAQQFAGRIKELFYDFERPGFEHLGGNAESWEAEQAVRKSAAAAMFSSRPDEALAWYQAQSPAVGLTPESRESEQGRIAGELSSRLYLKQPERAMAWIGARSAAYRAAAAAELGYEISARTTLEESRVADLQTLAGWIGDGPERTRWLTGLPAALADREQSHRQQEVAHTLLAHLDLTDDERTILENQAR